MQPVGFKRLSFKVQNLEKLLGFSKSLELNSKHHALVEEINLKFHVENGMI